MEGLSVLFLVLGFGVPCNSDSGPATYQLSPLPPHQVTQPASLSFSFLPGTGNHGSAAWLSWVVVGIDEVETSKSLRTIQGECHLEFLQLPTLLSQAKELYLLSCSSVKWE